MDPIAWSQMAPFATLGNINFSSAFFGLASIVQGVLVLHSRTSVQLKLLLVSFLLVNIFIILQTGSIQGVMIFIAGMGIVIFLKIRSILSLKFLKFPYLIGGLLIFILTFMALLNRGPLARFVFSETILYRFDYWFAGWAMTLSNPIFGLGLDSYGDYYREFRGSIATLRTNPDRITNTAHNIYLDLSSSGGFPLLFFYVLILALAFRASWRIFKNSVEFDVIFVSLFSVWIAYLLQAFISINQVGVGIWGWVFTGALVGYERVKFEKPNKVNNESSGRSATAIKKQVARQMPAGVALVSIATFTIGFFLAFIPFRADGSFRSASTSGSLESMKTASTSLGATAYHIALTLDGALKGSNEQEVREVADELISRYPRDFMGWRIRQLGALSTPKEREEATAVLERLDPFNPQVRMSK
jgi:hypothetical protein